MNQTFKYETILLQKNVRVVRALAPAKTLSRRAKITHWFSISSSRHLRPFLNREILNVELLRFRIRSIDHERICRKSERKTNDLFLHNS